MSIFDILAVVALVSQTQAIFHQEKSHGISQQIRSLDDNVLQLTQNLKSLELENKRLKVQRNNLLVDNQYKHSLLHSKIPPTIQATQQTFYGFTAFATAGRGYSVGDRVTFDAVRTNYGNAYSVSSSTFTCPVTGQYYFDLHLYLSNLRQFGASITVGSTSVTKVFIRADANDNVRGSASAVVTCQAGTLVNIICRDFGSLEGNQDAETSFSGFLISAQ